MSLQIAIPVVEAGREILVQPAAMTFAEGAIHLITGPNGSGKSLLLERIFDALEGVRERVLVCQDNNALLEDSALGENITLSPAMGELECLEEIGLNGLISSPAGGLSGGQKRRVCILRGIRWSRPGGVLMLDEPTNDLDPEMVEWLVEKLTVLKQDRTILLVTHDDRLMGLADEKYTIFGRRLMRLEEEKVGRNMESSHWEEPQESARPGIFDRRFFNASLKGLYVSRMFLAALAVIGVLFSHALILPDMQHYPRIAKGEVCLFTPNSVLGAELAASGAMPISALGLLSDDQILSDRIKTLKKQVETHKYDQIIYLPRLEDNDMYTVSEMEYYDPEASRFVEAGEEEREDAMRRPLSYCKLRLRRGTAFTDLVNDPAIQELTEGHYLVASAETVDFIRQVNSFLQKRSAIENESLFCGIALAVFLTLTLFMIYRSRTALGVFQNVGLKKQTLRQWVNSTYDKRNERVVTIAAACPAVMILHVFGGVPLAWGSFAGVLVMAVFAEAMSLGVRLGVWIFISKKDFTRRI